MAGLQLAAGRLHGEAVEGRPFAPSPRPTGVAQPWEHASPVGYRAPSGGARATSSASVTGNA